MELDPIYKVLPPDYKAMHQWAQSQPSLEDAENSQREWSDQSFARWLAHPQAASLGSLPLLVLTRADGGYTEDSDVTVAQMEQERKEGQAKLVQLSTDSRQVLVHSGHNMNLEAPDVVAGSIHEMVASVRSRRSVKKD
jgi:hypothetical protein